jgi:hypothetical protein
MLITNEYMDDHLPCVEFSHEGIDFNLCWTSNMVAGRLSMIEQGEVAIDSLKRTSVILHQAVTSPDIIESEDDDDSDVPGCESVTLYTDVGCLTFSRPKK